MAPGGAQQTANGKQQRERRQSLLSAVVCRSRAVLLSKLAANSPRTLTCDITRFEIGARRRTIRAGTACDAPTPVRKTTPRSALHCTA